MAQHEWLAEGFEADGPACGPSPTGCAGAKAARRPPNPRL